jgi:hypothetical protein
MDGYLALVKDESFETTVFTIYFYQALQAKTLEEMAKWTKRTHLFGTRLVHIPVNDTSSHWCMVTIDHQEKTVTAQDNLCGGEYEEEIQIVLTNIKTMMGYDILVNPLSRGFDIEPCHGRTTATTAECSPAKLPDTPQRTSRSRSLRMTCRIFVSGCSTNFCLKA